MSTSNLGSRASRILVITASIVVATSAIAQSDADTAFYQDAKVANFSLPAYGYDSAKFEEFSFWADGKGGKRIQYSYDKGDKALTLAALGPSADGKRFAARFPNGYVLDFAVDGDKLLVSDRQGRYRKTFAWMYEGPVEGRGTFCTPCVEEADAPAFVRTHFLGQRR